MHLEVTFRGVEHSKQLDSLITEKVKKLEKFSERITSCKIAIERPQKHQNFRMRIDLKVPAGQTIVAEHGINKGGFYTPLPTIIRGAFRAAERQLKQLIAKQRKDVKHHPQKELHAVIVRLFKDEGYGFIKTEQGREIYFHRNSVLNNKFDALEVGTFVRFEDEMGEEGPQATTVQVLLKKLI